jgi:sigma-B regulation protein RsbU (phosphoserine phosphatase)
MTTIEQLEKQIERLKSSVEELILLNDLALSASSSLDVEQMLNTIVQKSIKAVRAEQGSIMLVTEKKNNPLETLIRHEDFSGSVASYKIGNHISGWVLKYQKPLIIENLADDDRFDVTDTEAKDIRSVLCLPIVFQAKIIGILVMTNKKTGESFSSNDLRLLSIIAAQSGQLIRNSQLQQEAVDKKRLEQEMILAEKIQRNLLPKADPLIQGLDISSYFNPMEAVGGDYYDYFEIDKNRLGIVIADVSGHGPSAALIMTMIKGILHTIIGNFSSPEKALDELSSIIKRIGPVDVFITMSFMVINLKKRVLQFANAGHLPIIHCDHQNKHCQRLELPGFVLCSWDLLPESSYLMNEIPLQEEDILFIYTDGVNEAVNDSSQMFEISGIQNALKEITSAPADKIIEYIKDKLQTFTGESAQEDDIVMIAIKVGDLA